MCSNEHTWRWQSVENHQFRHTWSGGWKKTPLLGARFLAVPADDEAPPLLFRLPAETAAEDAAAGVDGAVFSADHNFDFATRELESSSLIRFFSFVNFGDSMLMTEAAVGGPLLCSCSKFSPRTARS